MMNPDIPVELTDVAAHPGEPRLADAPRTVLRLLTLTVHTQLALARGCRLHLQVAQRPLVSILTGAAVRVHIQSHTRSSHTPGFILRKRLSQQDFFFQHMNYMKKVNVTYLLSAHGLTPVSMVTTSAPVTPPLIGWSQCCPNQPD